MSARGFFSSSKLININMVFITVWHVFSGHFLIKKKRPKSANFKLFLLVFFNVVARGLRWAPDVINIVFPPGLAVGHAFSRFFLNSSARPPWLARWSWCQSWWREKDIRRKRRRTKRKRLPQWSQNLFDVADEFPMWNSKDTNREKLSRKVNVS